MSYVEISKLNTNYSYQRNLNERRVNEIKKEFDPKLLGKITISRHSNGQLFVIDGNHRVAACKAVGAKYIDAEIIDGLSIEQEAELFCKLNNGQKKPTCNEILRAKIEAKDKEAIAYKEVLDRSGIHYSFNGVHNNGALVCHSLGMKILKWHGEKHLQDVLTVLRVSGGCMDSFFLAGLSTFMTVPNYDRSRLIDVIQRTPYSFFARDYNAYKTGSGDGNSRSTGIPMAKAIAVYYNKGLRTNRIDISFFDSIGGKQ